MSRKINPKIKKILSTVPEDEIIYDLWHHPLLKKQGLSIKGILKMDLVRMLGKSLEEQKIEDSLKYAVELHSSGFGSLAIQTLVEYLIKYSGSQGFHNEFRKRLMQWELKGRTKNGINHPQTRIILCDMVGLLCMIKKPNILVEPRIKFQNFRLNAPSLDWVRNSLSVRGADIKDFNKEFLGAWNEILWCISEWTPDLNRRTAFEMASHCYHAWTYCLKTLSKTDDKSQIKEWLLWIWTSMGELGPWRKLKTWALLKPSNMKWNSHCMLRGWMMDPTDDTEINHELRLKISIQVPILYYDIINHCREKENKNLS